MKRTIVLLFLCLFAVVVIAGCAGTWTSQPIETFKPSEAVRPPPSASPAIRTSSARGRRRGMPTAADGEDPGAGTA